MFGIQTNFGISTAGMFYIEDLTRVVISYEMATSVRFCLSYDGFKWGFIALKDDIISIENITLSRTAS